MDFLNTYNQQIIELCKSYNVKSLSVFGSVLTNRFSSKSDIDFIVDFQEQDPLRYADNYFDLKFHLQDLLNRHIDLLESKSLKNPYLSEQIQSNKVAIYGN